MNITGYINVVNGGFYTFYSRTDYMSTVSIDDKYLIYNFYNESYNASVCHNSSELLEDSTELEAGYHKFDLFVLSSAKAKFAFDFLYSEGNGDAGNEPKHIDSYYKGDFETVKDFYITSTDYTFTVDEVISINFIVKNAVLCSIEPPLPEGLEIQFEELKIAGKTVKTSPKISYIFTCENLHTVSNEIILNIEIVDDVKQGLLAYYLKPINTEMNSLYFEKSHTLENDKNNLKIEIIRHELYINNHFTVDAKPWFGLSSHFSKKYVVEWKGLIYLDTTGTWNAELNCKDACFLYIDDKMARHIGGMNEVNVTTTGTFKVNDIGYHNFTFNLLVNEGGSANVIRLKKPGSSNEYEYIDNILYYISGNNLIQYNYTLVTYNTNVTIEQNTPINNTDKTIKSYVIEPDLPKGLILNKNGSITGKPTESSEFKTYTVKTSFTDNSDDVINEIQISVDDIEQLSGLYLYNNLTNERLDKDKTPVFPIGVYVELIIKIDKGYPYNFGCNNLPNGLVYHANTKVIEGYPTKVDAYFLNIYAISLVERINTVYTISVAHSCQAGYHMTTFSFLFNQAEYQAYLQDIRGNEVFTIYSLPKPNWTYQLCLKEDEYKLILYMSKFQEGKGFFYKILVDGITYYDEYIYSDQRIDSTMELPFSTIMSPPSLSYTSDKYTLETFSSLQIKPTVTNHPTFFNITPSELIKDLNFDNKTGVFEGASIDYFEDTEYTVIAENPFGKSDPVTLTFKSAENQCEENGKAILHLLARNILARSRYMFIEIKDKNNKVIVSVDGSILDPRTEKYDYYICIPQGDYKVTYGTTHINRLGWLSGYFELYLDKISVGHYAMPLQSYEMSEITTTVHFVYDIDINSKWEYKIREKEEDWNLPSSTTKWQETLLNKIPEIKADVLYLRKRITVSNIKDYSSYATKLDIASNFIFYMNGDEIYSHLSGLEENRNKDYYQFLFPIHKLEDGQFMVAIELHRITQQSSSSSLVFPYFRFVSFGIIGDESECSDLNYFGGYVVDEYPAPRSVGGAINAFLIDGENTWNQYSMRPYTDIWVIYSFGHNTFVPINQFFIIAGDNTASSANFPKNVTIEVLSSNGEWIEYAKADELNLENPFDSYSLKVLNSDLQINQIKFTLYINNRKFSVSGLRMVNCQFYTCPKTDYLPETITDSIVKTDCIDDPNGYRIFQCPFGKDPEWKELENNCESKPILLSSVEEHSFVVGNTEKPTTLFSISGKVKNVTVIPDLPECIISNKIGVYYSNCVYVKEKYDYMFVVENDIGSIDFNISIDIIGTNKPVIIESLSEYTFYADLYIDIAYLFQIVGSDLEFTVEPELPSGIKLNENIGYIYGKTSSCFIPSTYLFTCHNQYGSVKISVELKCISNQEPVVVEVKDDYNLYSQVSYSNYSLLTVAGRNLSYSIEPSLPQSLVLDSKTGYINGEIILNDNNGNIRELEVMENNYTVVVSNENGVQSKNISVAFLKPTYPTIISDSKKIKIPQNEMINNYKLLEIAGEVTDYEIVPNLPNGITFNKNGEISGIPLEKVGNKMYKFTLENSQGSNTVSMFLSFNVPEKPIIYDQEESLTFYKTIEINSTKLVIATGEDVIDYSITPALPKGISLSSTSAMISGTPTIESELTNYTVLIKNNNGQIATNISLEVKIKTCESDDIWPNTEMGKEYKIKCSGLNRGSKTRMCKRNNNDAVWEDVNEDCYVPSGFIILFSLLALVVIIVAVIVCVYFYYSYQKKKRSVKPTTDTKFSDI